MMKILVALFLLLVWINNGFTQEHYYYANNRKVGLNPARHWVTVQVAPEAVASFLDALRDQPGWMLRKVLNESRGLIWIETRQGDPIGHLTEDLAVANLIRATFPVFFDVSAKSDTSYYAMTDRFRV